MERLRLAISSLLKADLMPQPVPTSYLHGSAHQRSGSFGTGHLSDLFARGYKQIVKVDLDAGMTKGAVGPKIEYFKKLIERDFEAGEGLQILDLKQDDIETLKNLVAEYSAFMDVEPSQFEAYFDRGVIWYCIGEYPKALADFRMALQLNWRHEKALAWLARTEQAVRSKAA